MRLVERKRGSTFGISIHRLLLSGHSGLQQHVGVLANVFYDHLGLVDQSTLHVEVRVA